MRKQILEALKAKFQGVSEAILGRIADKLAKTVTTVEQVATAVEGVTIQQVIESYGDSRATEAQQTAVANYESKHGLKDGVKIDGETTQVDKPPVVQEQAGGENGQLNAILQQLLEQNKKLAERIDKMDGERTTATRKQQLSEIINQLPENLRKPYERTPVDGLSDEQFNTLVGEISSEVSGILNDTRAKGAVYGRPTAQNGGNKGNELSKEQIEAISKREGFSNSGQPF